MNITEYLTRKLSRQKDRQMDNDNQLRRTERKKKEENILRIREIKICKATARGNLIIHDKIYSRYNLHHLLYRYLL